MEEDENDIKAIEIQDNWCEEPIKVKLVVHEYFEERFCEKGQNLIKLDNIEFPMISVEDNRC